MNVAEFNTELRKLIDRAFETGITQNKMGVDNVVGILELQKCEVIRWAQDTARMAAMAQQQKGIVLPGDRRFQQPPNGA